MNARNIQQLALGSAYYDIRPSDAPSVHFASEGGPMKFPRRSDPPPEPVAITPNTIDAKTPEGAARTGAQAA
jgi:hypothetical protein